MDMFSNPTSGCALSLAITPTPLAADFDLQPPSSLTSLCQPTCRPPCTKHPLDARHNLEAIGTSIGRSISAPRSHLADRDYVRWIRSHVAPCPKAELLLYCISIALMWLGRNRSVGWNQLSGRNVMSANCVGVTRHSELRSQINLKVEVFRKIQLEPKSMYCHIIQTSRSTPSHLPVAWISGFGNGIIVPPSRMLSLKSSNNASYTASQPVLQTTNLGLETATPRQVHFFRRFHSTSPTVLINPPFQVARDSLCVCRTETPLVVGFAAIAPVLTWRAQRGGAGFGREPGSRFGRHGCEAGRESAREAVQSGAPAVHTGSATYTAPGCAGFEPGWSRRAMRESVQWGAGTIANLGDGKPRFSVLARGRSQWRPRLCRAEAVARRRSPGRRPPAVAMRASNAIPSAVLLGVGVRWESAREKGVGVVGHGNDWCRQRGALTCSNLAGFEREPVDRRRKSVQSGAAAGQVMTCLQCRTAARHPFCGDSPGVVARERCSQAQLLYRADFPVIWRARRLARRRGSSAARGARGRRDGARGRRGRGAGDSGEHEGEVGSARSKRRSPVQATRSGAWRHRAGAVDDRRAEHRGVDTFQRARPALLRTVQRRAPSGGTRGGGARDESSAAAILTSKYDARALLPSPSTMLSSIPVRAPRFCRWIRKSGRADVTYALESGGTTDVSGASRPKESVAREAGVGARDRCWCRKPLDVDFAAIARLLTCEHKAACDILLGAGARRGGGVPPANSDTRRNRAGTSTVAAARGRWTCGHTAFLSG
ncbi:hypothetical protein B0H10DRAFT_1960410 [Mycena sp. CBHHK59/15]|nr:hypothetical protein B0H10DRAFT_1960410 [Mycena sp. CBHHK59/15]